MRNRKGKQLYCPANIIQYRLAIRAEALLTNQLTSSGHKSPGYLNSVLGVLKFRGPSQESDQVGKARLSEES
jgi:hypothetical protein